MSGVKGKYHLFPRRVINKPGATNNTPGIKWSSIKFGRGVQCSSVLRPSYSLSLNSTILVY